MTSREAILKVCREIVSEKGISALNMREVAQACHVALGSLYNYFPSKDDLILAAIESVWQDIFHMECECRGVLSFPDYVQWIFESVWQGTREYPNFFTAHSLSFASAGKNRAKDTMKRYFAHMKKGLTQALHADQAVRSDAFDVHFAESDFIDLVLSNVLMLLTQQKESCTTLLEMIRRTIY